MSRWARLAVIVALAAVVIVPAILYISDAFVLRYRLGRGGGPDTITVYFATRLKPVEPPTVITTPPRDFGPNAPPNVYFTDPDVLTVDPSFNGLRQVNAPIQRLWTGALWSEGPAWSGQGRYLVWSDIPNNRQMRWLEDDGRVAVFRMPSNNSNGNTFDFQ